MNSLLNIIEETLTEVGITEEILERISILQEIDAQVW